VMAGSPKVKSTKLDGAVSKKKASEMKHVAEAAKQGGSYKRKRGRVFSKYAALSKVGFVPFNLTKVNQDRALEMVKFGGHETRALFGVFDGHGAVGHEVAAFVSTELPKYILQQKNLETAPKASCTKAFLDCNAALSKSTIDVTFSGTTGVACYITGRRLFCCNAGDSRAVLATRAPNGKMLPIPLSKDHKPDVPEEKKRILESNGRVEACKGPRGEDIGPPRVWLLHQEVPGLAMTRSFGDQVAGTVGVIAKPEIIDHNIQDNDAFIIIASDGVWEFISSQEAIDIVAKFDNPDAACRAIVSESIARWKREEEVIDDITAVIVFFTAYTSALAGVAAPGDDEDDDDDGPVSPTSPMTPPTSAAVADDSLETKKLNL